MSSDSSFIHTAILPNMNVSLYEALVTDLPTSGDVMDGIRADAEHVNNIVEGISILTQSEEIYDSTFPGIHMVYPRLIVYVFAHLMLCGSHKSILDQFKGTLRQWKTWDDLEILQSYQSIKDTLSDHFQRGLKLQLHAALHTEEDFRKLIAIDTIKLCAHLTVMVTDNSRFKMVLTQRGSEAQALLNLLQARLDFPINSQHRSRHIKALLELSRTSGLYPDSLVLRDVKLEEFPVASGSYGDVFRGLWQGRLISVKVMKIYQNSDFVKISKAFSFEAVVWRQLSHPNVLPFYGISHLEGNMKRLCLTAPWMENGNLVDFLRRYPDTYCIHLALDVALGLEHLHSREPTIVHGDLKGVNVLITPSRRACLADFGLASAIDTKSVTLMQDTNANTGGTARWQAPELNDPHIQQCHNEATDMYALACVYYEMFSGEIPFYDDRVETRVILGVMRGKRPTRPSDDLSNVRGLSDEMWKLIEVCWDEEPMRRPPIARVVEWLRVLSQLVDDRPLDDLNQNPPSQTLYNGTEHPFSVLVGQRPPTPQPLEKDMPSLRGAPDGFHGVPLMTAGPSASPAYRYQPQPRYTVELLIQDLRPLDITKYIRKDPEYQFAIGSGAGGDVYRGLYEWTDPLGLEMCSMKVAVKVLRWTSATPSNRVEQRLKREVAVWRSLNHPNVAQLLGIAYLQQGRPPGLVSRFLPQNNFLAYIGRHTDLKREKALDVACGLQYLHCAHIVHGDLKVDNVLVSDDGVAQLNDFGLSQIIDAQGFTTQIMRNIRFTAPELMPIAEVESEIRPNMQTDIFGLAMLLLQLFHGPDRDVQNGLPYNHFCKRPGTEGDMGLLCRIHDGERPIRKYYRAMSDQHWKLICECWQEDPSARPDIAYVVNQL